VTDVDHPDGSAFLQPESIKNDGVRAQVLRARVERHLQAQGFVVRDGRLMAPVPEDKNHLRDLHAGAVRDQRDRARPALQRFEERFIERLLSGPELIPNQINPVLVPIEGSTSEESRLWRWATLHWSIPISTGYGRRLRFLAIDRGHRNAVMGVIGLSDPVYGLSARDNWIGWSPDQRREKLICVMDAFVLGAIPPYNMLCGGKLIALLACSSEVREAFRVRYAHRPTLIEERDPNADLALVTTTSALGRSSTYNRLTGPGGKLVFHPIGYTQGTGDFHLTGGLYDELAAHAAYINSDGTTYRHKKWPRGTFRNRREVIQRALDDIGLNSRALRIHGIRRQIFAASLAANSCEWLRGECEQLDETASSTVELADWWKARWAVPRASRISHWKDFQPCSWKIW
jgi:Domain of unknown function (DUF4338)